MCFLSVKFECCSLAVAAEEPGVSAGHPELFAELQLRQVALLCLQSSVCSSHHSTASGSAASAALVAQGILTGTCVLVSWLAQSPVKFSVKSLGSKFMCEEKGLSALCKTEQIPQEQKSCWFSWEAWGGDDSSSPTS